MKISLVIAVQQEIKIYSLSFSTVYRHRNDFLDLTLVLPNRFIQHLLKGSKCIESYFLSCLSFLASYSYYFPVLPDTPTPALPQKRLELNQPASNDTMLICDKTSRQMDIQNGDSTEIEVTKQDVKDFRFTDNLAKRNSKNYMYKITESGLQTPYISQKEKRLQN